MADDNDVTTSALAQHADAAERARRAWAARVAGGTWSQAAQVAGFTDAGNCCRAVKNYFGTLPVPDRAEQRDLWRERLELLWRQSVRDVQSQRPGAVRAAVALSQRAAQLDGLDEPTRQVVYTPRAEEVEAYIQRLGALQAGQSAAIEADVIDGE